MRRLSVRVILPLVLVGLMVAMESIAANTNTCVEGNGSGCFVETIEKSRHLIKHKIKLKSSADPKVTLILYPLFVFVKSK